MASAKFSRVFLKIRLPYTLCIDANLRTHLVTYSHKYSTKINSNIKPKRSSLFLGIVGLGAGALVGAGYSYFTTLQTRLPISNDGVGTVGAFLRSLPDVEISRKVS